MYEMLGIKSNFDDQTACGVFYLVCTQRISLQSIKKGNKINLVSFEHPYSKFRVSSYSKHYVRSPIELSDSMYSYKYIMYIPKIVSKFLYTNHIIFIMLNSHHVTTYHQRILHIFCLPEFLNFNVDCCLNNKIFQNMISMNSMTLLMH